MSVFDHTPRLEGQQRPNHKSQAQAKRPADGMCAFQRQIPTPRCLSLPGKKQGTYIHVVPYSLSHTQPWELKAALTGPLKKFLTGPRARGGAAHTSASSPRLKNWGRGLGQHRQRGLGGAAPSRVPIWMSPGVQGCLATSQAAPAITPLASTYLHTFKAQTGARSGCCYETLSHSSPSAALCAPCRHTHCSPHVEPAPV